MGKGGILRDRAWFSIYGLVWFVVFEPASLCSSGWPYCVAQAGLQLVLSPKWVLNLSPPTLTPCPGIAGVLHYAGLHQILSNNEQFGGCEYVCTVS